VFILLHQALYAVVQAVPAVAGAQNVLRESEVVEQL